MSGLSDAIQHTQIAIQKCQELVSAMAHGIGIGDEIGASLVAGLDGTGHIQTAAQYQAAAKGQVESAMQAAQQLAQHLAGLVAQFQAAGG